MSGTSIVESPRVLVVDDDASLVQFVRALGRRHFFDVVSASSVAQALQQARLGQPHAILIDLHLGPRQSGLDLPQRLRQLPGLETVPVGFLSDDAGVANRIAASKAGAAVYLLKPVDPAELVAVVHRLVAMGTASPPQILVVAQNASASASIAAVLASDGISVATCGSIGDLPQRLSQVRPDLLLVLADLSPGWALDICRVVRSLSQWHDLYITLLIEPGADDERRALRAAGADEWLPRHVAGAELLDKVRACVGRMRRLRERFERDPLTGLLLRRTFLEQAGARLGEAQRRGGEFAFGILDMDNFKSINDGHGHHTGDMVLARLGRLLQTQLRAQDLHARWGGDEFCFAFSSESAPAAAMHLARVLSRFREQKLADDEGRSFDVSFSGGVAAAPADGCSIEALLRCADERLYQAKRGGGGQVSCD